MRTSDKVINVNLVYNAFDITDIKKDVLVYRKNTKLKTYLKGLPTEVDWVIGVNGQAVTLSEDGSRRLKPNDTISLIVVPRGRGAKNILRMVALVAVAVAAAVFAPQILGLFLAPGATASAGAIAAVTAGITLVGGVLINAILPPSRMKIDSQDDGNSYGYDGAKNTVKQGIAMPVVYGMYRVAGNYVDLYSENLGDDQYLYGRTVLSEGEIDSVTLPLMNDQPIDNYLNVEWGHTLGTDTETFNRYFGRNISQINKSMKLSYNVPVTHTSTQPIDQAQFNFTFPRGLTSIGGKGKKNNKVAGVRIEMKPTGGSTWGPIGSVLARTFAGDIGGTATGSTRKLLVDIVPAVESDTPTDYSYTVEYKLASDSVWTTHVTKEGTTAQVVAYQPTTTNWEEVSFNDVDYTYQAPSHHYEIIVPEGVYNMRVVGSGTMTAWGYIESTSTGSDLFSFNDSRLKPLRRTVESGQFTLGTYDFRITKTNPDGDDETEIDELYLSDIGEIITTPVALTNVATAWYRIKMSEQLSNIPSITWLTKGVKLQKYDLNGEETVKEWDDNPAWIVLDMLIGEERGSPQIFNIDFPKFLEWAEWCEDQGLKFNGVFDSTISLWDACQEVLRVGHAAFARIGTKLSLTIDKPSEPVMLFGPGNIMSDSFKVSYLGMSGRANEFELSYFDKEDNNSQKTIRIVDPDANNRGDMPRPVSFQMRGIDNFEQAQKEAWYQLYNNRYLRRTVTFDAPIESIGLSIGDVALVQHDSMNWGESGRLESGSTTTVINLDKPVEIESGPEYSLLVIHDKIARATGTLASGLSNVYTVTGVTDTGITLATVKRLYQPSTGVDREIIDITFVGTTAYVTCGDGGPYTTTEPVEFVDTDVIEERDISTTPGIVSTVTVTSPFSATPAQYSNYMFGDKTIVKKPYRLKSTNGTGFDKRTLTLIEYNPAIYNEPEHIVPFPPTSIPKGVKHVTDLRYAYDVRANDANTIVPGVVSWNAANITNYGGADIYVALNDADFVFSKTVLNVSEAQLDFHFGDNVKIKVVAFNNTLVRAPLGTAPYITVEINAGAAFLDPPTGLNVVAESFIARGIVIMSWSPPVGYGGLPLKYRVQVQLSGLTTWDEYGITSETSLRIGDLPAGLHTFRVRTERAEAKSVWVETTYTVVTTSQTVEDGATNGAPVGSLIGDRSVEDFLAEYDALVASGGDDPTPPDTPTGLAGDSVLESTGGATITLSWTASTATDLVGYDIQIKEGSGTYIGYTTATNTYTIRGVKRATSYTFKVRSFDKSGNYSAFTAPVTYTTAADSGAPLPPSSVSYLAAFNTAQITWTCSIDTDILWTEVVLMNNVGTTLQTKGINSTPSLQQNLIFTGLTKSTTYTVKLRTFDTSNNASGYTTPISVITAGGLDGNDITPNSIVGDRIVAGTVDADRLAASTVMANTIKVSGYTSFNIGEMASWAEDPAARINTYFTQIDPGRVLVSAGVSLTSWRNGSDTTLIEGGKIAANTITANKLTIGNRAVSFDNIDFQYNPTTGQLVWTAGEIHYLADNGLASTRSISANGVAWAGVPYYIYWTKGNTFLSVSSSVSTLTANNDVIILCTWRGTYSFTANYGGTIIDGAKITTGTVNTDQLKAGAVTSLKVTSGLLLTVDAQINNLLVKSAHIDNLTVGSGKITNGAVSDFYYVYQSGTQTYTTLGQTGTIVSLTVPSTVSSESLIINLGYVVQGGLGGQAWININGSNFDVCNGVDGISKAIIYPAGGTITINLNFVNPTASTRVVQSGYINIMKVKK